MAGTITEDELMDKARELGTVGAATKWMRQQGLTLAPNPIPPANRELPPVEPQGGLKTAEEASTMAADTGEEDTGAEDATGALDYASIDFSKLKDDPGNTLKSLLMAVDAAEQRKAATAKRLYEEGEKRILEKYAGPSQSERLFALSRAMLSPTDFPGFKGFLGNVTGALGESAKAAREAEQTREQKLFELRQQYLTDEAERAAARPKTALEMAKTVATLSKTKDPFAGAVWDPENQRWVAKPGSAGGPPVLTPQQVAELSRDPRNRGMKFYTTDGRPMEIK